MVVWLLFLADLRLIRQRQAEAVGPAEEELYGIVLRDQHRNIFWLVPGMALFNFGAVYCLYLWPEKMIGGLGHVAFAVIQTITLVGYLIYVVRFYGGIAPIIQRANQEESAD